MNKQFVDTTLLEDYLDGKLDAKAMHFVERLSLEDPFIEEALEGLRQAPHRKQTLSLLQKQLATRVAQLPVKRKLWGIATHRLSIAATAAVLFVTASIAFWMREQNNRALQERMAGKKVDVELAPIAAPVVVEEKVAAKQPPVSLPESPLKPTKKSNDVFADAPVVAARKALASEAGAKMAAPSTILSRSVIQDDQSIAGVVRGDDGQPIPGAKIQGKDATVLAVTDIAGSFKIPIDSLKGAAVLTAQFLGYERREFSADPSRPANVTLKSDATSLDAVVITAGGVAIKRREQAKMDVDNAESLKQARAVDIKKVLRTKDSLSVAHYLIREIKPTGVGAVLIEFTINKNGLPSQFKVLKSLDKDKDAKAIELLTKGPKWQIGEGEKVIYPVNF